MKINVETELRHGRSGIEARAPALHLASHGLDEKEALSSLERGIVVWCRGLQSRGKLERAMKAKKMKWSPDGESIVVELEVI